MKILDLFSKLVFVVCLILLFIAVDKLSIIAVKESPFYEYNGNKINLNMVKTVRPRIDYIITYQEDDYSDLFHKYSTVLDENEINNIKKFLELAQKSEFYSVKINAYMMLDKEKIVLYNSEDFLKSPSKFVVDDYFLNTLRKEGLDEFQYKNLLKIKSIIYDDSKKFFEDVISYAKLKDSIWMRDHIASLGRSSKANKFMSHIPKELKTKELKSIDIEDVVHSLKNAYSQYIGIR